MTWPSFQSTFSRQPMSEINVKKVTPPYWMELRSLWHLFRLIYNRKTKNAKHPNKVRLTRLHSILIDLIQNDCDWWLRRPHSGFQFTRSHRTSVENPISIFLQQVSRKRISEQIGPRICFNSMPKCRVPDSFTLRRVTRDGKGPQSCQLASNLCIQRHLNAVAKGTERKRER